MENKLIIITPAEVHEFERLLLPLQRNFVNFAKFYVPWVYYAAFSLILFVM